MPSLLVKALLEIKNEQKLKKIKARRIYVNQVTTGTGKLSSDTIHDVFKKCQQILKDKEKNVEEFTTTIICPCVYNRLFTAGYSLEEIAAFCNTSIGTIVGYISDEEIEKIGKRKLKKRVEKHPLMESFTA